uniref:Uncharacterized protein n=1 Tax=Arundo donax TaxID=35708 RepID=A0A0A8Z200_ARUDO
MISYSAWIYFVYIYVENWKAWRCKSIEGEMQESSVSIYAILHQNLASDNLRRTGNSKILVGNMETNCRGDGLFKTKMYEVMITLSETPWQSPQKKRKKGTPC